MASIDDISHAKAGLPGANRTAPETRERKMVSDELNTRLNELVLAMNTLHAQDLAAKGWSPEAIRWQERKRYCAIDIGSSGAFLVDKETGELYNIKAYGVPDLNKKRKADIGNVFSANPAMLLAKRYNYLR